MLTISSQDRETMSHHLQDVWFVRMQIENTGAKVSQEEAYVAWSEYSRSQGVDWVPINRNRELVPEMLIAHRNLTKSMDRSERSFGASRSEPGRNYEHQIDPAMRDAVSKLNEFGYSPNPGIAASKDVVQTMEHIAGRYSNIAYMAGEIDRRDGVPPDQRAPMSAPGAQQFNHLESSFSNQQLGIDKCYVALRRLQREGEHEKLKAGVALLVLADKGVIGHADVLAAVGNDGMLPGKDRDLGQSEPILIRSKGIERDDTSLLLEHARDSRGSER